MAKGVQREGRNSSGWEDDEGNYKRFSPATVRWLFWLLEENGTHQMEQTSTEGARQTSSSSPGDLPKSIAREAVHATRRWNLMTFG
uniref:Uncharacterized protein n=1 Tax=Anopheles atroparvus TaxID=41427 RepID=A0AAG5DLN7_ANOAO